MNCRGFCHVCNKKQNDSKTLFRLRLVDRGGSLHCAGEREVDCARSFELARRLAMLPLARWPNDNKNNLSAELFACPTYSLNCSPSLSLLDLNGIQALSFPCRAIPYLFFFLWCPNICSPSLVGKEKNNQKKKIRQKFFKLFVFFPEKVHCSVRFLSIPVSRTVFLETCLSGCYVRNVMKNMQKNTRRKQKDDQIHTRILFRSSVFRKRQKKQQDSLHSCPLL